MKTDEVIARWRSGQTLAVIAEAAGTSRQAVSRRLIRAGYSPRERQYAEAAANGSDASASRLEQLTARAEARDAATERLRALARELGISVRALVTRACKAESDMVPDALADRVHEVCEPFSPDYLAHVTPSA